MKWYQDTFTGKSGRLEKSILEGFRRLLNSLSVNQLEKMPLTERIKRM